MVDRADLKKKKFSISPHRVRLSSSCIAHDKSRHVHSLELANLMTRSMKKRQWKASWELAVSEVVLTFWGPVLEDIRQQSNLSAVTNCWLVIQSLICNQLLDGHQNYQRWRCLGVLLFVCFTAGSELLFSFLFFFFFFFFYIQFARP